MFMYPNKVRWCESAESETLCGLAWRGAVFNSWQNQYTTYFPLCQHYFRGTTFSRMCHRANRAPAFPSGYRLGGVYRVKVRWRGVEDVERREQAPALRGTGSGASRTSPPTEECGGSKPPPYEKQYNGFMPYGLKYNSHPDRGNMGAGMRRRYKHAG